MNRLLAFLKLIRWPNLLIIFLTQGLLWYCILQPLERQGTLLFLSAFHFLLLSGSTLLIAGGGNLINDVYDIETDKINKPNRVIVDRFISKQSVIILYALLNLTGLGIGFYLAFSIGNPKLAFIQIFSFLLLFRYANRWKKSLLTGNLAIALLTALSILIVPAYEPALSDTSSKIPILASLVNPYSAFLFFAYFAFLTTLIREIAKDIEDVEGDKATGGHTLPVCYDLKRVAKIFALLLFLLAGSLIFVFIVLWLNSFFLTSLYFCPFLLVILLFFWIKTGLPNTPLKGADWSRFIKTFMVLGLLSALFLGNGFS